VTGVGGGVGPAQAVPGVAVDQRDGHRLVGGDGLTEQVDGDQRAAGAAPDDRDDGPVTVVWSSGNCHLSSITYKIDKLNV
jgi:hypothetical protein